MFEQDCEFRFPGTFEDIRVRVVRFPLRDARAREITAAEQARTRNALHAIRFAIQSLDRKAVVQAQRICAALRPGLSEHDRHLEFSEPSPGQLRDLIDQITWAFETGALVVLAVKEIEPLKVRRLEPELPPLPPPRRVQRDTSNETFFEVRLVDEIGEPIPGIEVEFEFDFRQERMKTNGVGAAVLDGVTTFTCSVRVVDVESLDKALESRWARARTGKPRSGPNKHFFLFPGESIGPIALKAAVENTVVIQPRLGRIEMELWDKSGRAPHAGRNYRISGPQSFTGQTDDHGVVLHEEVFRGDYTLELELDDAVYSTSAPVLFSEGRQLRLLGVVPHVVLARLLGMYFDTDKTFLLPTALKSLRQLRELYVENSPCELLIVGHTDTTGNPSVNDSLSLARAESVAAFLRDDVDVWLSNYKDNNPKRRWGNREDSLMIRALPDFRFREPGEEPIRWYQRTRGIDIDGKPNEKTRKELVAEYLSLDGSSLADEGLVINVTVHGCGENFPLDTSGENLDQSPQDNSSEIADRRVELFFFDPEFGILPPPPSKNSKAGSKEYPEWRARALRTHDLLPGEPESRRAMVVELHDALFRTNSCVILPEGESPTNDASAHESVTSIGIFASLLRFNEEHPGKKLLIAGHTDSEAGKESNQKLSEERAQVALALLTGDRETFRTLCHKRHKVSDYKQVLSWAALQFDFDCDPGKIDDNEFSAVVPVRRFQQAYNAKKQELNPDGPDLEVDGDVGPLTWGAFFDCYQAALRAELDEDDPGLADLRDKLVFVDANKKTLGFGEHHPIDGVHRDNFRSQANRRVELILFDKGEEPDLEFLDGDPEFSEIYTVGQYARLPIVPMISAKKWVGTWDGSTAGMNIARTMQLRAPELPTGTPVLFEVALLSGEVIGTVDASSDSNRASATFEAWDAGEDPPFVGQLQPDAEFPMVEFQFIATGGGRRITSRDTVVYSDRLLMRLVTDGPDADVVLANEKYVLCSPWGRRSGVTDANGLLEETGLPPGGASIAVRGRMLIDLGELEPGWNLDG